LKYGKFIPVNWNEELKEGQIVEGTVKNIKKYGAFINRRRPICTCSH